jgi:coenzyme F420-reducing hydrogenase delta subunit
LPDIIRAGSTFNQQTAEVVSIEQKIDLERDRIFKYSYAIGDKALANQQVKAFDKKILQLKTGAVADFVLENPIKNTNDLLQGKQVSDPHIQDILNNMNDEERREAVKLSIDLADKERSRSTQIDAANARKRADIVDDLLPEITDAKIRGETDRLYGLLGRLRELDGAKYESIASAIHTEGGIDNAEVVSGLNRLALNDQLTFEDINAAAKNRQISSATHLRLLGDLKQQRDGDFKDAVDFAKDELGYPTTNKLSFTDEEKIAAQKVAKLRNELRLAIRRDPALDRTEFMIKRVREMQAEVTYTPQQIGSATSTYKGIAEALRQLGYNVDRDTPWEVVKSTLSKAVSDGKYDANKAAGYNKTFKILGSQ